MPERARNHILVVNNIRFLIPPSVKVKGLAAHVLARCQARVAQDSTSSNYRSHPHTEGLGPINDSEQARGLIVHDTTAFTPPGTPLGLLNVQCWTRGSIGSRYERHAKPIEEKESWRNRRLSAAFS